MDFAAQNQIVTLDQRMHDSKSDVANLLHEEAEVRSVQEFIRRKQQQQAQQKQSKNKNRDSWER